MTLHVPNLALLPRHSMMIGETMSNASGPVYEHLYPATGKATTSFALAGAADVDHAVAVAREAFRTWRTYPTDKRRNLLLDVANLIESHTEELTQLGVIDNATPLFQVPYQIATAVQNLRYYAGWADKIAGLVPSTWEGPGLDYVTYNPYGVIGSVIPWNGPIFAAAMVMAPALAVGNCIVIKPPELAPYSVIRMGELFLEAGFPAGVVNIVTGGPEAGEALVSHPGVDKVQFVGSGATAKKVLRSAADTLKPCGLELGGKSAVIVFDDADLDGTVGRALGGVVGVSGQGCVNGTRALVQRGIYERFVETVAGYSSYVKIGDPLDTDTQMGPVISEAACQRILGVIDNAVSRDGARLVTGGKRMDGDYADGFFLPVTIIADVDNRSALAQHEVFGPVLSITPFDTEEEAIALANATDYGLGGYIHTCDLRRAHAVADALDAGMIRVNGGHEGFSGATPFGGYKQSGYGRLGGQAGLHEFLQTKNVWVNLSAPAARS